MRGGAFGPAPPMPAVLDAPSCDRVQRRGPSCADGGGDRLRAGPRGDAHSSAPDTTSWCSPKCPECSGVICAVAWSAPARGFTTELEHCANLQSHSAMGPHCWQRPTTGASTWTHSDDRQSRCVLTIPRRWTPERSPAPTAGCARLRITFAPARLTQPASTSPRFRQ